MNRQKIVPSLWFDREAKEAAVPEAEQCGWVKDKFGVSWQIVPANMGELIGRNPARTTPVMLRMKKIIIADLELAGRADVGE